MSKSFIVDKDGQPLTDDQRLAVTLVLLKMAEQDRRVSASERRVITDVVAQWLALTLEQTKDLTASVEALSHERGALLQAIEIIRDDFGSEQRTALCQLLTKVSLADGKVTPDERTFGAMLEAVLTGN